MRSRYCMVLLLSLLWGGLSAQELVPEGQLMTTGAYYYPEHWPKEDWKRDLQRIKDLGFEFTHFGEFAWTFMEPREGQYAFGWLDTAIAYADEVGLKVILCTPSAIPPVWLTEKYPDILMWNERYRPYRHGSRQHGSWSSSLYRTYVEKINTKLAQRYGKDERVIGWQIDNEPAHSNKDDYSPAATKAFRQWLKAKYGSIQQLNHDWGTAFWSWRYNDFEQIGIPNPANNSAGNPHHVLDYKRFYAWSAGNFINAQIKTLRTHISEDQWVTTNYMDSDKNNQWHTARTTDLNTITMYPGRGSSYIPGKEGFRYGDGVEIAQRLDFGRSVNGKLGVMELQPGQVNWSWLNPKLGPWAVNQWLWHAYAAQSSFVCTYRFRQPRFGSEQYHHGLVGLDGTTLSDGGRYFQDFNHQLSSLREAYKKNYDKPEVLGNRKAGILYDYTNIWQMEQQAQTVNWNEDKHLKRYYELARRYATDVRFVYQDTNLNAYDLLIAPAYQNISKEEVARWKRYVEQGGHLILSCRTGHKDKRGHLWEALHAEPIWDLMGAEIRLFDHMPPARSASLTMEDTAYAWRSWADVLEPREGTQTWAYYSENFYKGKSAVCHRKLGKGSVTYIGAESVEGDLEEAVFQKLDEQWPKVDYLPLPKGVFRYFRDGFWIVLNYSEQNYKLELGDKDEMIIGSSLVQPNGVAVWKRKKGWWLW